jgi:hypothetical protein
MNPLNLSKTILLLNAVIFLNISLFSQTEEGSDPYNKDKPGSLQIRFLYTDNISKKPISGRNLVGFQKDLKKNVNPDLFDPQPAFAMNVKDWRPGETVMMNQSKHMTGLPY